MGISNFFKSFLTKDKVFYDLFDKVVNELVAMSLLLKDLSMEVDQDRQSKIVYQIKEKEKINDETVSKLFNELSANFITPFDREDIHALATALDDVSDNIYAASKKMHLYRINPVTEEFQALASLIVDSVDQVRKTINELKNMKNMKQMIESIAIIKQIESQSDDVFDRSIQQLFDNTEIDAKEFLKMREIFSKLESVSDKCEDAANVVESILVKYA